MQKVVKSMLALFMAFSIVGCSSSSSSSSDSTYKAGTYTASEQGFGGEVTVTITTDTSSITKVEIEGANETPDRGGAAIEKLQETILEKQTSDVDIISGSTITSEAVIKAASEAIAEAKGEDTTVTGDVKMKPGTYDAEAYGFFVGWSDKVRVTVDETSIVSIEWNPDKTSGDTPPMLDAVEKNLFPRIIEHQSVNVDGVTGATATSGAVKSAVKDALTQALVAGGSDEKLISTFETTIEKGNKVEELDTDLLVVGLGGSGTYTALQAAEQGVKVLAIEKQGRYGGTTALTSEIESINPPRIMEEYNNGEEYTDAEAMKSAWKEYVEGDEKEEMLDLFFEQSGPALDWLALDHNIEFDYVAQAGFTESDWYKVKFQWYPNTKEGDSRVFGANKAEIAADFDSLINDYTKAGGEYMLETTAYELITDANGTVTGVKARNNIDGTEYTINAKAVVLATGGFLGSGEMTTKYLSDEHYPLKGTWNVYGSKGNDGAMLEQAIENGAATYNIGMPPEVHMSGSAQVISPSAGYEIHEIEGMTGNFTGVQQVWSVADLPTYLGISSNSLAVASNGKRFSSETGIAMLDPWKAGPNYYSIWSTDQLNDIKENGFKYNMDGVASGFLGYCGAIPENTALPETFDVLETGIEMGFIYKADTIEELASLIGVDASTLKETVDTYNGYCESGVDEEYGKDAMYLETIGEGPYYAIKMASYSYNTVAGLDINANFQVLDTDGNAIEGLFAVGSDSAGVLFSEKKPYVTYGGANNGWALTSGYVCGVIVADYLNGTNTAAEKLNSSVLEEYGGFNK